MGIINLKNFIVLYASGFWCWEHDYLTKDLFPEPRFLHMAVSNYTSSNISDLPEPKILVYNIENSGEDAKYQVVQDLITKYKITILVHTSDEFQGWSKKYKYGEGIEVYYMVPFVLREFSVFPYQSYDFPRSNVVQLPLGYISKFLSFRDNNDSSKNYTLTSIEASLNSLEISSSSRQYLWTFIGEVRAHKDRRYAIEVFSSWKPHFVEYQNYIHPTSVREIYYESKFVIVGRGHVNLDCFKIYEATIAGAIPIVVGPEDELNKVFQFEGDFPGGFLFASSYEEALLKCQNMTDNDIDELRKINVNWYIQRIQSIQRKIDFWLGKF